ncbi:hypothetical protein PP707_02185 [Acetobacter pasteurianus]|nr:hypothetical protein [Acetobacter pasteurianus]
MIKYFPTILLLSPSLSVTSINIAITTIITTTQFFYDFHDEKFNTNLNKNNNNNNNNFFYYNCKTLKISMIVYIYRDTI